MTPTERRRFAAQIIDQRACDKLNADLATLHENEIATRRAFHAADQVAYLVDAVMHPPRCLPKPYGMAAMDLLIGALCNTDSFRSNAETARMRREEAWEQEERDIQEEQFDTSAD